MTTFNDYSLQESESPMMIYMSQFNDHVTLIMTTISFTILLIMMGATFNKFIDKSQLINETLEIFWSSIPIIICIFIALPSITILYLMDNFQSPNITMKVIAHQWFWSYEYSDFINIEFDSYLNSMNNENFNQMRLLDVDNRLILPYNSLIRMIITSQDVLHSWAVPALAVKMDAIPGRLNQTLFSITKMGLNFGQCSEICGLNHSFMPICLETILPQNFIVWIKSFN
uniref:Cytochrome c oxidase subunit 2 n=1 Tax=Pseudogarypus banksi TaxID=1131925 RepID=H9MFI4_9ARAC|nr:cytochrome c oxidase subunit 2 [Pseudogarypus banksi]